MTGGTLELMPIDSVLIFKSLLILLTRGTSGLLLSGPNFQTLPSQLLIGCKKVPSWLLIG